MSFNGWKLLVAAPLAVTLLSACGGRDKKDNSYRSQFAGAWLEEAAARDYFDGTRDGSFCARVNQNAAFHGIRQNQAPVMHAWMIQNDGRVLYWSRGQQRVNAGAINGVGLIGPDGMMSPYAQSSVVGQQVNVQQMWTFRRSDRLLMISRFDQRSRRTIVTKFVSVTSQQLDDYSTQFVSCTGQEFEDRTYYGYRAQGVLPFDGFDNQPGPAFGPGGPVDPAYAGPQEPYGEDDGLVDPQAQTPQTPRPRRPLVQK